MVLFVSSSPSPCLSSAPSSCPHLSSSLDDLPYEVSTCSRNSTKPSTPLPLRSFSRVDSYCDEPVFSSPLSSSAESISSIKSNCSSRSSAEREAERAEKKELLNLSLAKIRSNANLPMRKHLLVYNSIKKLQRELDLLDDEDLYCNLVGDTPSMEVDERRWLAPMAQAAPQAAEQPAPPTAEERAAPVSIGAPIGNGALLSEDTWSWSAGEMETDNTNKQGPKLFEPIQDVFDGSFSGWGWDSLSRDAKNSGDTWASAWQPLGDLADPFANSLSRFELQHLFPSQLLLQA